MASTLIKLQEEHHSCLWCSGLSCNTIGNMRASFLFRYLSLAFLFLSSYKYLLYSLSLSSAHILSNSFHSLSVRFSSPGQHCPRTKKSPEWFFASPLIGFHDNNIIMPDTLSPFFSLIPSFFGAPLILIFKNNLYLLIQFWLFCFMDVHVWAATPGKPIPKIKLIGVSPDVCHL